jgi:hypothetical protein
MRRLRRPRRRRGGHPRPDSWSPEGTWAITLRASPQLFPDAYELLVVPGAEVADIVMAADDAWPGCWLEVEQLDASS